MRTIYGLTIEGTDNTDDGTGIDLPKLLTALGELPRKPVLRLCLEVDVAPKAYVHFAATLRAAGYPLMIQPVDSSDMHSYSIKAYANRIRDSLLHLNPYTDFIELSNEINGDWCGSEVLNKMNAAIMESSLFPEIKKIVTVYVTEGFEPWIKKVSQPGVDYLFFSCYPYSEVRANLFLETYQTPIEPPFLFGIGEYGSEDANGKMGDFSRKVQVIRMVEELDVNGGFYWDFYDDCVKNDTGILEVFRTLWKK